MKTILMAAVAAVTLGMTGAAMADQGTAKQPAANSQLVMPSPHATYVAQAQGGGTDVLPSQRPAYLAAYLPPGATNQDVLPSQRPSYLA